MSEVIATCQQVAGVTSKITWVEEEFLLEQKVAPYTEMPLWVPKSYWWMSEVNIAKAVASGLQFRPLRETVADTLAWAQARTADYEWINGLNPEREQELLETWKQVKR
jgi:2'-hydroxyisoflavone reductase